MGSRCGRIGIASPAAAQRGCRWAGSGPRLRRSGLFQNKLARLVPGGRAATLLLGEWVEEYLEAHQGERVTVPELRWLRGKATAELGGVRLVRALARTDLRMAADRSGGTSLRSDSGASAGAEPRRRVEADRREPGQARGAESWSALPRAAAVRILGPDPFAG